MLFDKWLCGNSSSVLSPLYHMGENLHNEQQMSVLCTNCLMMPVGHSFG